MRRCTCCPRCGSATRGATVPHMPTPRVAPRMPAADESAVIAASHRELGERWLYCEPRMRRCSSPTTRPTTGACSARPNASAFVKDGFNDYSSMGGVRASTRQDGHEGGGRLRDHRRARQHRRCCGCGFPTVPDRRVRSGSSTSTRRSRARPRRPTRSTRRSPRRRRARTRRPSCGRRLAGMLWTKQRYFFDLQIGSRSTASVRLACAAEA